MAERWERQLPAGGTGWEPGEGAGVPQDQHGHQHLQCGEYADMQHWGI